MAFLNEHLTLTLTPTTCVRTQIRAAHGLESEKQFEMCFKTTRQVVDIRPNFPPQGLHNQCFILVLLNERYHTAKNLQVSRRSSEQACWNLCQTLMGDQKAIFHSHDVDITSASQLRQHLTGQRTDCHLPKSMLRQLHSVIATWIVLSAWLCLSNNCVFVFF